MDLQISFSEISSDYFQNKLIIVTKCCVATITDAMEEPMWKLIILAARHAQPAYGAINES